MPLLLDLIIYVSVSISHVFWSPPPPPPSRWFHVICCFDFLIVSMGQAWYGLSRFYTVAPLPLSDLPLCRSSWMLFATVLYYSLFPATIFLQFYCRHFFTKLCICCSEDFVVCTVSDPYVSTPLTFECLITKPKLASKV